MTVRVPRAFAAFAMSALVACAGSTGASNSAATAPAPAAVSVPKPFEYAAMSGQYRYTAEAKTTQSMMGRSQESNSTVMRLMTISLARSAADTVTMSLTIDSITSSNSMGMPTMGIDKVPGTKYTAKIAPNGSFYSATGPSETENPLGAGLTDEVGHILPRLKAILKVGAAWSDSLQDTVKQSTLKVGRDLVTKFTVAGDTTVAGESAWKITREIAIKATGAGTIQGQAVTIESTGSANGILVVSKRGVLLGGRASETSNNNVVLTMNGMQVGVVTTTDTQFSKVK